MIDSIVLPMERSAPQSINHGRGLKALVLCVGLYALVCLGCAAFQRRLIYFPPVFPAETVLHEASAARLMLWTNQSGEPIGWKRPSPIQPARGQVLITHGNAGCAFQCAHYADAIQQAAPLDVFLVEYPGYADRGGSPSEKVLYATADEAFEMLPKDRPIFLVGESLGTGVACYLAGRYPNKVGGIALLAPYSRLADVAQAHIRIFPASWVLAERFPSEDYLREYHGPVAVLAAGRDRVVPERFARRLYEAYSGPKKLWLFPEADHEALMRQPAETWSAIVGFWSQPTNPSP